MVTPDDRKEVFALLDNGITRLREIAKRTGMSRGKVFRLMQEYRDQHPETVKTASESVYRMMASQQHEIAALKEPVETPVPTVHQDAWSKLPVMLIIIIGWILMFVVGFLSALFVFPPTVVR